MAQQKLWTIWLSKSDRVLKYSLSIDSNVLFYISADASHTKAIVGVIIGVVCLCISLIAVIVYWNRKGKVIT